MSSEADIYPMPLFVRLTVEDLSASVAWYRALGFAVVYEMPVMAHLRYRTYADVMLVGEQSDLRDDAERDATTKGAGVQVYLTVEEESVDDVAARATAYGVDSDGPRETGWNTRELTLRDPDGYELVFAEQLDANRSFEDVMGEEERTDEPADDPEFGSES
jgi:predicted lactoylglutathione lyase